MNTYPLGRGISCVVCRLFGRAQIIGEENIPEQGGVLLCGNHVSYLDPPAVSMVKRPVRFMAKAELFKIPLLGPFIGASGTFPVKRGTADRGALKKAIECLKNGEVVGMFPEGTRNYHPEEGMMALEAGAGMIVLRAQVPVIPVALVNTEKVHPPHSLYFHFNKIKIVCGKPVVLDDLYGQSGR